jgi:hypothetical protein
MGSMLELLTARMEPRITARMARRLTRPRRRRGLTRRRLIKIVFMSMSRLGRTALAVLLVTTLSLTSSCAMLASALSIPLKLLGSLLGAFSSNPIGAAAAGAALM